MSWIISPGFTTKTMLFFLIGPLFAEPSFAIALPIAITDSTRVIKNIRFIVVGFIS
jgi:hypothetical protein